MRMPTSKSAVALRTLSKRRFVEIAQFFGTVLWTSCTRLKRKRIQINKNR